MLLRDFRPYDVYVVITVAIVMLLRDFRPYDVYVVITVPY
jgi:hypothetical protein